MTDTSTPDISTPDTTPTPEPLRAADADRHATVEHLQDAVARGLLTTEEGSERMAAAYAARHLSDLPPLTADLPPVAVPPPAAPGWRGLVTLAWLQLRATVASLTRDGWRSRRGLLVAAGLVAVLLVLVTLGVAGVDLLSGDPHGVEALPRRH